MTEMHTLRAWFAPVCLIVLVVPPTSLTAAERAEVMAALNSITRDEVQQLVDTLADDSFEGREAGSRGGRAAGNLLMKEFEKLELKPAGEGQTYFQGFRGSSRNILGLLQGSDPALAQEIVVLCAHYDHVGYGRATNSFGPIGYIHNGADDNASGVSAVLEIAEALRQLPAPPRRSILFAYWDAEEQGLLGSQHWLATPTLDRARIVAALNLDMVGRLRDSRLEVFGTRSAPNLRRIVSAANRESNLDIDFSWLMKSDSDHWPFFSRSIPTIMFHTRLHGDYHRPSDDAHTVNAAGIESVTRVALLTVLELAERPQIGKFRDASRREHQGTRAWLEQPVAPQSPRYGIPFNVDGQPPRFVLSGVTPGSPAEKAGLRAGDRLVAFQGTPIADEKWFRLALLAAEGQTAFTVERAGEARPLVITVKPAGPPIRVGITWRSDDAEPGTVLLTQVVYGSPAHVAGLEIRDRIYAVNGQTFADEGQFTRLITTLPGPLALEFERQGRIKTATLEVLKPAAATP
ncbi:MAG: M20/M25/M40 family metallo-hydrolase [Planctomycetaceae bacterium]|nr:M20/M25/M40 family metallo-hydrolase [Planctomycetaceae bacterium]